MFLPATDRSGAKKGKRIIFGQAAALGGLVGGPWRWRNVTRGCASVCPLPSPEDFAGEWKEGAGFVVPLGDAFQSPRSLFGLGGGHRIQDGL
jgi:hypothetical protein